MPIGKIGFLVVAIVVSNTSAQDTKINENFIDEIWSVLRSDYNQGYSLPSDFAERPASEAALEFVDLGRSEGHRKQFKLTFPDDPKLPPTSGWLVLDEIPHSCWVSSKEITLLSLDEKKPRLIIGDHRKRSDCFRTDPSSSTNGYGLRIIELTPQQSRTIIELVWALHQIQTFPIAQSRVRPYGSSSADARGYLYLSEATSYLGKNTIWYTDPIQESWIREYDEESFLNFTAHFFSRGIPALLKDQWQPTSLRHTSRTTPSHRTQNRNQLAETFALLLQEHEQTPLPSQLLAFLTEAIGECGFIQFKEPLLEIKKALPPLTELEEFILKYSFYGSKIEDYDRYRKRNLTTLDLRDALDRTLAQLGALDSDQQLITLAYDNYGLGDWARRNLLFSNSKAARNFHLRRFYDAPGPGPKSAAMTALTHYSPQLTRSLVADLSDRRWKEFAPDFAHVFKGPNKQLEQSLKAIALDPKIPELRRAEAVDALGNITPDNRQELISFLSQFSQSFENSSDTLDKDALLVDAIEALLNQGAVSEGWTITRKALLQGGSWSHHQLPGLGLQFLEKVPSLKPEIESSLVEALKRFPHLTNETALLTLHLDLPNLHETIVKQDNRSLEIRLATLYHAQKSPFDRFAVLSSWAVQNHWHYDSHPTLFSLLESLAKESTPEKVNTLMERFQSRTDHDGYELILRLKSLLD